MNIHSFGENLAVGSFNVSSWIGLTRENGTWIWKSGDDVSSALTFDHLKSFLLFSNPNCATIQRKFHHEWVETACNEKHPFACEKGKISTAVSSCLNGTQIFGAPG